MGELWSRLAPGFDCLSRGHIWVEHEPENDQDIREAQWCLWCGSGVSNEHEAGWGAGAP